MKKDETDKYRNMLSKAMALCSKREYCISDIREKLKDRELSAIETDKIINVLIKENFINEKRYCEAFTREKFRFNKWGRFKIYSHLNAKKIAAPIIEEALASIDNDSYINSLRDLLAEHRKHIKAKNKYDLKGKLMRYGLSKGFESSLLYDILNDM